MGAMLAQYVFFQCFVEASHADDGQYAQAGPHAFAYATEYTMLASLCLSDGTSLYIDDAYGLLYRACAHVIYIIN